MKKIFRVFAFAVILAVPALASAAGKVPAGFVALSESPLTWDQAQNYCRQQGGKLPLIKGSDSLSSAADGAPIDGFGAIIGPWPAGLPQGMPAPGSCYWMGTRDGVSAGNSWVVYGLGGKVLTGTFPQSTPQRVVCVP